METYTSKQVVAQFWTTMQTNDWRAAAALFADDYVLEWPQSGERIVGRDNFVVVNAQYPAAGRWQFAVQRLLAEGDEVVSEVVVTDGVQHGRAITFSNVRDGLITRQVEFWPDSFDAPAWRAPWVERENKGTKE